MEPFENLMYLFSSSVENRKIVKLAPESVTQKIRLIKGLSKDVANKWTEPIGLIFIDGDHSYDGVALDIKKWCPFVVKGGYAIFHDVVGTKLGLDKLTDNLVKAKGWKFVESADTMVVLQRGEI